MIYTVTWLPAAENELAAIWVASGRRAEVTAAATALDHRLGVNGPDEGESRDDDTRLAFEPPLVIFFRADHTARTVAVAHVKEYG